MRGLVPNRVSPMAVGWRQTRLRAEWPTACSAPGVGTGSWDRVVGRLPHRRSPDGTGLDVRKGQATSDDAGRLPCTRGVPLLLSGNQPNLAQD